MIKKLLLTFSAILIINTASQAQWVNISDPNFVTWLNNNGFGACMNGTQMDTTCTAVTSALSVICLNSSLSNIDGVRYFDSLKKLNCSGNNLASLPPLPATLTYLDCNYNDLVQLPALPPLLDTIWCVQNLLTSLPVLPSGLKSLDCYTNDITVLPAIPSGMTSLRCAGNLLTALPTLPNSLTFLGCFQNQITSLGPSLPASLYYLQAFQNNLTSIPPLPANLIDLDVKYNQLTVLPTPNAALKQIQCENNQITALPPLPNLYVLKCSNNPISTLPTLPGTLTTLEASNCPLMVLGTIPPSVTWMKVEGCQLSNLPATLPPALTVLCISDNMLTQIPPLPNTLRDLRCQNNLITSMPALPNSLLTLYSYNNLYSSFPELPDSMGYLHIGFNPNLTCLPQLTKINTLRFDMSNVQCIPNYGNVVNSTPTLASLPLCDAFNPNSCPFFYNISGNIYRDLNSDCVLNSNEASGNGLKVNLYQGGNLIQQGYSSQYGLYTLATGLGTYDYTVDTVGVPFQVTCPASGTRTSTFTISDSLDFGMDFGLECKPGFDVGIHNMVQDSGTFRPGHSVTVKVRAGDLSRFFNLNCASGISGTLTVYFSGPVTYSGPAAGSLVPVSGSNYIQYSISDFNNINFNDEFRFIMNVDVTAQSGQQVCFLADVTPLTGDLYPNNNQLTNCYTVVNSFDPNDKQVSPTGDIESSQEWLTYTIRFQNTGTASALHIVVADTLQSNLDVSSFQFLGSSHTSLVEVTGNVARFTFANINLPDSTSDEPNSHGYVQFKIKYTAGLAIGSVISNNAAIYFDFNPPVLTNTTTNTLVVPSAIQELPGLIGIYPVPATSHITISVSQKGAYNGKIYDLSGRSILTFDFPGTEKTIFIGNLPEGIYFVELVNPKGNKLTSKIVILK